MTDPRFNPDLDQLLGRWMDEVAPEQAPTRLLEETFVRTMDARQQGTFLRSFDLRLLSRLAMSAAAIVIAISLAAYLFAPGGRFGGRVAPSPSPTPTSPSPSPTTFASRNFLVPISMSLSDGWEAAGDGPGIVNFGLSRLNLDAAIVNLAAVTVRGPLPSDPWVPWPDDPWTWLGDRPEFQTIAQRTIEVGGLPALVIDVETVPDQISDTGDWLKFGIGPSDGINLRGPSPERWHLVIVKTGVETGIVAVMGASPDTFDEGSASFDRVLATLQFR